MDSIPEYVDERHKGWCIYCGTALSDGERNNDHVPSKALLLRPLPENLPTIPSCVKCNNRFSTDEEYFFLFLNCVLSGSTNPDVQNYEQSAKALRHHKNLRAKIERSEQKYKTIGGETRSIWKPEYDRINRVIIKNSRGHIFYEYGEPIFGEPNYVQVRPCENMTAIERENFESTEAAGGMMGWPEVGSRMLTRLVTGQDMRDGWVVVQDKIYRYCVQQSNGIRVRCVLYEYLAAEVFWSED